jgi:quercetin dioxygenase-like cupin family protein
LEKDSMNNNSETSSQPATPLPPDDPQRSLALARPNHDQTLPHIGLVGDTYTILLTGKDTAGRYCVIDMHVPPGGGPPPHRHDFEETFSVLEGEIEVMFRGEKMVIRAGETAHIPANAPHAFTNASRQPARLLCICSPAGQEEFFLQIGTPVTDRTEAPPELDEAAQMAVKAKAEQLAPKYRSEFLRPA